MKTTFNKHPLTLAIGSAIVLGSLALSGCGDDEAAVVLPVANGNYTINTAGGTGGDNGTGGSGSNVDVYLNGGTGGVKVLKAGKASTAFTSQKGLITPDLGNVPLVISANTTIHAAEFTGVFDSGGVPAGAYYMGTDNNVYRDDGDGVAEYATEALASGTPYQIQFGGNNVYLADGGNAATDQIVTGIQVNAGATLTLPLVWANWAWVGLRNDVVNKGAIITEDWDALTRGSLDLAASSYVGSGTINTAGTLPGQSGGDFYLRVDYSMINSGAITTSGASLPGGTGGSAGYIDMASNYYTENTGALTANGGSGVDGGNGDYVYLYAAEGPLNNSGDISSVGGNGTNNGGSGNYVELYAFAGGKLKNSGDITTSGGSGTVNGGGSAGYVYMYGHGPLTANSGNITAVGGNAGNGFTAGDGGYFELATANGYSSNGTGTTPTGNIQLSGHINLAGGSAVGSAVGTGGNGGYVDIWTSNSGNGNQNTSSTQKIVLLGYKSIDTHGGDGLYPGRGGTVSLFSDYGHDGVTVWVMPAGDLGFTGPVINEAAITTSAGNLTAGSSADSSGARAGNINLETAYNFADKNPKTKAINRGKLTLNGGTSRNNGFSSNNRGGGVWMWGYHGTTNSASITSNGGNDVAADGGTLGVGGRGNWIELYAEMGKVTSSATITANGGYGEYAGGPASDWTALYGPSVNASGAIKGKGGDANTALAGSMGGYGGSVWLMGTNGNKAVSHGTITLTPGSGNLTNDLWLGGNSYQNSWGTGVVPVGYYKVVGAQCDGDC